MSRNAAISGLRRARPAVPPGCSIITWPASYGAQVDFLVPENLSFGVPDVRKLLRDGATPGLFDELEKKCGNVEIPAFEAPDAGEKLDAVTTCFAAEVLRTRDETRPASTRSSTPGW